MDHLVNQDVLGALVRSYDRRTDACEQRVLHAAVGEAGWENDELVDAPLLGACIALYSLQVFLCIRKLADVPVHARWLCDYLNALSDVSALQIPGHKRYQIGGDWHVLLESLYVELADAFNLPQLGAHEYFLWSLHANLRGLCGLGPWGVLQRRDRPTMNCFALSL